VVSTCPSIPDNSSYPRCSEENCFIITGKEWREFVFDFDPKNGPFVEVIVLGWCGNADTGWSVNVGCPE
jgi:hypothetical protein